MKYSVLLFFLCSALTCAAELWPSAPFAEVRAYAWPATLDTDELVRHDFALTPGAINPAGDRLTAEQISRLRLALVGKHNVYDRARCYVPHNAFVFYDKGGKPVAFVEICFECRNHRAFPEGTARELNLMALATIFDELALPMGNFKNLKEFEHDFRR